HQEPSDIDSRALVMQDKRIYAYSHKNYLVALDTQTGKPIWRQSDEKLLQAIGEHDPAQTWQKGFSSQIYLTAGNQALFFAGPQRTKTVAVSMKDGKILWDYPDGNMLLVSRDNALYALGKLGPSKKFHPQTGEILSNLPFLRGNCTRVTGTADSLFARGDDHGGTLRVDMAADTPSRFPAMRPACQDGVIAANGLLYWGPWVCDCNHSLIGFISMAPAGNFDYTQSGTNEDRLDFFSNRTKQTQPTEIQETDWPTYRKTNQRTSQTPVVLGKEVKPAWEFMPNKGIKRTAPIAVGNYTYVSGENGIVYALDTRSGALQWAAYTGGEVHYPPCYWEGRLFVGSADGWVYAMAADTGQTLWRFRAAPVERKIPVYGKLYSTWPVTSVLVEEGIVYAAAGIVGNDGTHLYALNAQTGEIVWQNNTSGHLFDKNKPTGVSVQGHMLLFNKKLYLAGGNAVSPAMYDIKTGQCLNQVENEWQKAPRGKELFVINGEVKVFDQMLYAPREYIPSRYYAKYLLHAGTASDIAYQGTDNAMMCIQFNAGKNGKAKSVWKKSGFNHTAGVVVTNNAILTIGGVKDRQLNNQVQNMLTAMNRETGERIFDTPLPAYPASWGMAVDRNGTILVTTDQGHVLGYQTKGNVVMK
ncbi:PQQ-binding-like beta-propeller repeat protein, partial [bacterium]|nr:PQQ-binding-like beta-propeller repeat protein [bacterium]